MPTTPTHSRRPGEPGRQGQMVAIVEGLTRRFRVDALIERHDSTVVLGAFAFVNGCIAIGVLSVAALVTGSPFVFPSLGPTAFLHFYTPLLPAASPRNTLCGHTVGVAAAVLSLGLFGLSDAGPAITEGMTGARVGAVALSLGLTSGAMVWLKVPHPPAGATTMIVSLGILTRADHLAVLLFAVVLLTLQGLAINRLAGIPYPLWAPRPADP